MRTPISAEKAFAEARGAVRGAVVIATVNEIAVGRQHELFGEVVVHFPAAGVPGHAGLRSGGAAGAGVIYPPTFHPLNFERGNDGRQ